MQSIVDLAVTIVFGGDVAHWRTPLTSLSAFSSPTVVCRPSIPVVTVASTPITNITQPYTIASPLFALKHDSNTSVVRQYLHALYCCRRKTAYTRTSHNQPSKAGFSLSRALFRKMCRSLLGRQTLFFLEKMATFCSHHRLSTVGSAVSSQYIFCWKTGDLFCSSLSLYSFHSFTRVSPIISGMHKICRSSCGGPCSANMLNMPKSAATTIINIRPVYNQMTIIKLCLRAAQTAHCHQFQLWRRLLCGSRVVRHALSEMDSLSQHFLHGESIPVMLLMSTAGRHSEIS